MDKNERRDKLIGQFLSTLCALSVLITIIGTITYFVELDKEDDFGRSECLVLKSEVAWDTCYKKDDPDPDPDPDDPRHRQKVASLSLSDKETSICYYPVWSVEYNDSTTSTNDTRRYADIDGSMRKRYNSALCKLNRHPINSTYMCYYDKRPMKTHVEWEDPTSTVGLILLIIGLALLSLLALLFVSIAIIYKPGFVYKKRHNYSELINE